MTRVWGAVTQNFGPRIRVRQTKARGKIWLVEERSFDASVIWRTVGVFSCKRARAAAFRYAEERRRP